MFKQKHSCTLVNNHWRAQRGGDLPHACEDVLGCHITWSLRTTAIRDAAGRMRVGENRADKTRKDFKCRIKKFRQWEEPTREFLIRGR